MEAIPCARLSRYVHLTIGERSMTPSDAKFPAEAQPESLRCPICSFAANSAEGVSMSGAFDLIATNAASCTERTTRLVAVRLT